VERQCGISRVSLLDNIVAQGSASIVHSNGTFRNSTQRTVNKLQQ
jgi:hypothetical protein